MPTAIRMPTLPGAITSSWKPWTGNCTWAKLFGKVEQPVIQSVTVSTNGLILTGSGDTNATYYLVGTTNLAAPISSWTRRLSNQLYTALLKKIGAEPLSR